MEVFIYMKATGIVRRIDDLGRVVIPKEIRRTLRIREGDPMEIFTDREGQIILKKYSPLGEMGNVAQIYAESLAQILGLLVCITDTEQVIASAGGGRKEFMEQMITKNLREVLQRREAYVAHAGEKKYTKIIEEQDGLFQSQVISPVICEGDIIGGVILLNKEAKKKLGETELKMAACAASFLGRQME